MRCFADMSRGIDGCSALRIKKCDDCAFYKTVEQKLIDDERTKLRRDSLKDKIINIFN